MRKALILAALALMLAPVVHGAAKKRVISFGQALPVKLFIGSAEEKSLDMKVRALYVDGRLREFTTGDPYDVTDRLFVVRRAYRLNDSLPADSRKVPNWKWQRGGWLLVDRDSGRVSQLALPDFEPYYSVASWYRDYVAHCGVSDNGEKLYAVVAQLGRKKAVLRRDLGGLADNEMPDSQCGAPVWQRQPTRVTFQPHGGEKLTFTVRGHAADLAAPGDVEVDQEK